MTAVTASWLASDSPFAALLSATAVVICLAASVWIAVRRPGLGLIFFFFLFAFAWRLVSVLYIDLSGPLISQQLALEIGPGTSVLPIAISQGLVIVALLFSFRRQRMQSLTCASGSGLAMSTGRLSLPDLAFCAAALFVVALWAEFLARGQIPLLAGIERFDYTRLHGGFLHRRLMEWGPMLALQLGIFFAAPLLHDKPLDWRFGALLGALILYLFLAGHRFSSFYVYASFFVMPIGAILIGRSARSSSDGKATSKRLLAYFAVGGVALAVLVVTAVVYSYVVVRGEGAELLAKLSQRILVQQGEMWWMTYKRVFLEGNWNGSFAAYKLFVDPFDPSRNSTMQFLMESALPLIRAHRILGEGSAYSGGWPEVLFELGGPIGGFVLVALSAIVFSEFMFLMTRCIVQERYATCFFLTPLLYAVSVNLVSGMVNSFIQVTFLIKVVAALVAYVAEEKWRSRLLSRQPVSSGKGG
jgi:hypothetical protein